MTKILLYRYPEGLDMLASRQHPEFEKFEEEIPQDVEDDRAYAKQRATELQMPGKKVEWWLDYSALFTSKGNEPPPSIHEGWIY